MIVNYFVTALRNMRRRLGFTLLNIFGLSLGVASCLLIFLVVRYELGFDGFNSHADQIYRVNHHSVDYNPQTSPAVARAMRNDFPELVVGEIWYDNGIVKIGNVRFNEDKFAFADENIPRMFDYQWMEGDPKKALTDPNSIVLTESMVHKYFGTKEAMGQRIRLENQWDCMVTGVVRDLPGNTSLPFKFLVSMATIRKDVDGMKDYFNIPGDNHTFVMLPRGYPIQRVRDRIHGFIEKNWGKDIAKQATLILQPLREVHFDQRYLDITASPTTSRQTYWALAGIAVFIIITACINFINLATGQAASRSKEVGVRKVMGARREQLIRQFLGETAIQVVFAIILGVLITAAMIPFLPKWLDISIHFNQLKDPTVIGLLAGLVLVIIPLAGLYPAFVQSAFRPVVSLKGVPAASRGGLTLRRGLVVMQFGISQLMIIGTIVVARQMDFFQNRDLGFKKDFIITFPAPDSAHRVVLWQELSSTPGVSAISFSSAPPPYMHNAASYDAPQFGLTGENITEVKLVDEHYIRMFGLTMLAGDTIARRVKKDSIWNVVVNETLVHSLNMQDPHAAIGQRIDVSGTPCRIIGVVKDFQSESKHKKRRACVLAYNENALYTASAKVEPTGMRSTIDRIDKLWSALYPDDLFQYEFLDDHIATFYRQEQKFYTAFRFFSCIAIIIGCLGLYGLIAFATLQRTKEMGVRKVLGASVGDILFLFSKEFIWLILAAFLISAPVAWVAMHSWLSNFAYQIGIGWETFLVSVGVSFIIAALTISYKATRAALANPVKSLRTE